MSPGDLLLDERTAPAVVADLQKRGHHVETRPPYDSGAAPAIIRLNPRSVEAPRFQTRHLVASFDVQPDRQLRRELRVKGWA
jgi:hypothetical protein